MWRTTYIDRLSRRRARERWQLSTLRDICQRIQWMRKRVFNKAISPHGPSRNSGVTWTILGSSATLAQRNPILSRRLWHPFDGVLGWERGCIQSIGVFVDLLKFCMDV
mmetsp:Transcript_45533/g.120833  ORF Transcript_45533/g.120833 Transcript_45533/m.120833 type:complete len:108 (-) Transcript_45533:176-499(-)